MIACKGLSSEHLAGQLSSGKEGGSLEKLAIRQLCEEEYLGSLGGELHGWILGMAIRAGGCMAPWTEVAVWRFEMPFYPQYTKQITISVRVGSSPIVTRSLRSMVK